MLALLATAALAAATTLSTEQAAGTVAAYDGTVVWSSYDSAAKDYRLVMSKDGGAPAPLPVAPRSKPFDVDLGTNANGSVYAVYTRCAPGCDIYRLGLATGVETHLTQFSSPTADERNPTIQAGRIAFLRRDKSGGRTYDYLRMGSPGATATTYLGVKVQVTKFDSLDAPELSSSRIAYTRISEGIGFGEHDIHVRTLSGSSDTKVYTARSGGANSAQVTRPSLTEDGKAFVWARTNNGSGAGNRLVRYVLASGKFSYALGKSTWISTGWASTGLGAAAFVDGSGTGTCFANVNDPPAKTLCSVSLTGPVTFDAKP